MFTVPAEWFVAYFAEPPFLMHDADLCSFSCANSFLQVMSDCCIRQPFVTPCYVLLTYVTNTRSWLRAGKAAPVEVVISYAVLVKTL